MTVDFIRVELGFFRTKYFRLQTVCGWDRNYLPSKEDYVHLDDVSYRVVQKHFIDKDYVKLYITR